MKHQHCDPQAKKSYIQAEGLADYHYSLITAKKSDKFIRRTFEPLPGGLLTRAIDASMGITFEACHEVPQESVDYFAQEINAPSPGNLQECTYILRHQQRQFLKPDELAPIWENVRGQINNFWYRFYAPPSELSAGYGADDDLIEYYDDTFLATDVHVSMETRTNYTFKKGRRPIKSLHYGFSDEADVGNPIFFPVLVSDIYSPESEGYAGVETVTRNELKRSEKIISKSLFEEDMEHIALILGKLGIKAK